MRSVLNRQVSGRGVRLILSVCACALFMPVAMMPAAVLANNPDGFQSLQDRLDGPQQTPPASQALEEQDPEYPTLSGADGLEQSDQPSNWDEVIAQDEQKQSTFQSSAQAINKSKIGSSSAVNTTEDQINPDSEFNDIVQAFSGWSQMYSNYVRSPLVIDPRKNSKSGTLSERKYPEMANCKRAPMGENGAACANEQRPNLISLEMGTDDEIIKTSMAAFQPLDMLKQDFSNSKPLMHQHIDLYGSLRAAAELTLAYIDKTVASALASTQQQVSQDVTHHLLKQVLWTTSRMANPHRAHLYVDMDEKVEVCLADIKQGGGGGGGGGNQCQEKCGEKPTTFGGGKNPQQRAGSPGQSKQQAAGAYSWCVCCAEVSVEPNVSSANLFSKSHLCENPKSGAGSSDQNCWSLVERVFFGTGPRTFGGAGNNEEIIQAVVAAFREMYGDIVFLSMNGQDTNGGNFGHVKIDGQKSNNGADPELVTKFIYPAWSVPHKVLAFRDGCQNCDGQKSCKGQIACPITGLRVSRGIYGSLEDILDGWPGIKQKMNDANSKGNNKNSKSILLDDQQLKQVWIEASLGHIITAADIEAIRGLDGNRSDDREWKLEDSPKAQRWVDSFADASAVAAFRRLHVRLKSIALDHITLNQKASPEDKQRLLGLIARVDQYLQLAEEDAGAGAGAQMMLTGVNINNDRQRQAVLSAGIASNLSQVSMVGNLTGANSLFGTNVTMSRSSSGNGSGSGAPTN